MDYSPIRAINMFTNNNSEAKTDSEIKNSTSNINNKNSSVKSKNHTIPEIVNSMSVIPKLTANLSSLVQGHVQAQEDKKNLRQAVTETYLKYRLDKDNINNSSLALGKAESTISTLNNIRRFATNFVVPVLEFFEAILTPIIVVAWEAMTAVLGFVATSIMEFVLAPIVEVVTALAIANPIVWGIAGSFAVAAGIYYLYKKLTGGSVTEDVQAIKEKITPYVAPIVETVSNIVAPISTAVSNMVSTKTEVKEEPKAEAKPEAKATKNKEGKIIISPTAEFTAGAIKGLTVEETHALANAAAKRESSNILNTVNSIGYVGLYQFGAEALAETGFVDLAKYKAYKNKKTKYKNQSEFLAVDSNWAIGNLDAYMNSKESQDLSFRKLADSNLKSASANIKANAEVAAGFILSAHLLGANAANTYVNLDAKGRAEYDKKHKDAFGTTLNEYNRIGSKAITDAHLNESTTRNDSNVNLGFIDNKASSQMQMQQQMNQQANANANASSMQSENTKPSGEIIRHNSGLLYRLMGN